MCVCVCVWLFATRASVRVSVCVLYVLVCIRVCVCDRAIDRSRGSDILFSLRPAKIYLRHPPHLIARETHQP